MACGKAPRGGPLFPTASACTPPDHGFGLIDRGARNRFEFQKNLLSFIRCRVAVDTLPVLPEHIPAVPEHVPAVPEHVPAVPEHVPVVPEHLPVVPEHVPLVPEHLAVVPERVPVLPEHVPEPLLQGTLPEACVEYGGLGAQRWDLSAPSVAK